MAKDKELTADEKFEKMLGAFVEAVKSTSLSEDKLGAILEKSGLATAAGMQKALRPENEQPPLISAFNPKGDRDNPKIKLSRKTFLNGHPEHSSESSLQAEMLLEAEIESYNALGSYLEGRQDRRIDARNGLYKAELRNRNTELHIDVPVATLDTRANLPPTLIMLCHELQTGESMMDLNAMLAEMMRLRAENERLGGSAAGTRPTTVRTQTPGPIAAPPGATVAQLESALDAVPHAALA